MNFDLFEGIDVLPKYKRKIIDDAKSAERNVLVSPYHAMFDARVALETLCKALIKSNHFEHVREKDGNVTLSTMIDTCAAGGAFTKSDEAHTIRANGNDIAHGKEQLRIVNEETVGLAMQSVRYLYEIFSEAFPEQAKNIPFDVNRVPFDFYEIVRAVPKARNEVIFGDFNYFVKDHQNHYYYFQILHKNSASDAQNDLGARSVEAENRINKDKKRTSYLLNVHYPCDLMEGSDRNYIAYSVYSDSKLLSEVKPGTLTEKQTVQVGIDLLNVLLELKRIGDGIHLRNIQPGNVVITPNGGDYMAGVVNMETAKINNYDKTVYVSMADTILGNLFLPLDAKKGYDDNIPWDKVDIYSVAMVMVYCMDDTLVKELMDTDALYSVFSEKVAEVLFDIFNTSLNQIDDAKECKEKLEHALEQL